MFCLMQAGAPKLIQQVGDRVRLVAYCNDKAPLEENRQQVLLEVIDTSSTTERSGLDLVAVLDVSGSMSGPKLHKLKTAMMFVISKLGPMDRLSIVSFSTKADRQCPLRVMTGPAQEELKEIVEKKTECSRLHQHERRPQDRPPAQEQPHLQHRSHV